MKFLQQWMNNIFILKVSDQSPKKSLIYTVQGILYSFLKLWFVDLAFLWPISQQK